MSDNALIGKTSRDLNQFISPNIHLLFYCIINMLQDVNFQSIEVVIKIDFFYGVLKMLAGSIQIFI